MLILIALLEAFLLALTAFGDVWLFRIAVKQRRLVFAPAIVLLTGLVAALGYALLVTLAFQQCVAQDGGCFD
jgi:hypothetical protein